MKIKNIFSCPQEILYTIAIMGWTFCRQFIKDFNMFKSKYTDAFIDAAIARVDTAKAMVTNRQRSALAKEARIALETSTATNLAHWQTLKRYIADAYPKSLVKAKLAAAGAALYPKASVDNWSAVRSLLEAANTFILDNFTALTANDNMPALFKDTFNNASQQCYILSAAYFDTDVQNSVDMNVVDDVSSSGHLCAVIQCYKCTIKAKPTIYTCTCILYTLLAAVH